MKALFTTLVLASIIAFRMVGSSSEGAWQSTSGNQTTQVLVADNYFMQTLFTPDRFIRTRGGTWNQSGDRLTMLLEFDSADSTQVGKTETTTVVLGGDEMRLTLGGVPLVLKRLDAVSDQTPMAGLWRITARANTDGVVTPMARGARKTLKLLTGSHFQWAAINPQTKQFSGTGGGTYSLQPGADGNRKYTETIGFFSRDNSRVGKSLTFDNKRTGDDWLHTGLSSTGGKVSEVWSKEK